MSLVPNLNKPFVPKDTNTLPNPLSSLYDEDSVGLTHDQLSSRCESISLTLSETDCKNIEFATRKQSTSPVWFEQRRGRITASRLRAVCHTNIESPSKSLIKAISYPEAHRFSSEATKWGIKYETIAREQYEETVCEDRETFTVSEVASISAQSRPTWKHTQMGLLSAIAVETVCAKLNAHTVTEMKQFYKLLEARIFVWKNMKRMLDLKETILIITRFRCKCL